MPLAATRPRAAATLFAAAPVALLLGLGACRSGEAEEPVSAPKVDNGSALQSVEIGKDEEQALYLQMLQIELDAGVKVPKDRLHTVRGLAACRADAEGAPVCDLRVALGEEELSAAQPLRPLVSGRLMEFAREARPELASEPVVLADLVCDYIGKKSPPYTIEAVKCRGLSPRSPGEAVFEGRVAQELAEAVRGSTAFGTGVSTVAGSIACRSVEGSERWVCFARARVGGVLQADVKEISSAAEVARRLRVIARDRAKVTAAVGTAPAPALPLPRESSATVTCRVDSARLADLGVRAFFCRAAP